MTLPTSWRSKAGAPAVPAGFSPSSQQLKTELARVKVKNQNLRTVTGIVCAAAVAVCMALILALFVFPVVRVFGTSMVPALQEGDVVVTQRVDDPQPGDLIAFYYGNELLVKRVIAGPDSWVDILADGTVTVDAVPLDEPYVLQKSLGECTVELPYKVPQDSYFVLGDSRSISVDSRNSLMGAVGSDQIVGKLALRVWPLSRFGLVG